MTKFEPGNNHSGKADAAGIDAADICLSMEDVSFSYQKTRALAGLSFFVKKGEIFGFLGPSGAGKTTTIKLLTAQLKPEGGLISLFGENILSLAKSAFDRVGVLSDNSGLYERLSVYDNLALFAELSKTNCAEIMPLLQRVGLSESAKKPASKLSRGMRQRVMLARAVLHKPALLFLDEPTASLDPATTHDIHELLRELNAKGTTVFLTTHNMEEADSLCNRVAFLNSGTICACDTPESLKLQNAENRMTARFESGRTFETEKNPEGLSQIHDISLTDPLLTLHSKEPNLEEVFLRLTGRDLK